MPTLETETNTNKANSLTVDIKSKTTKWLLATYEIFLSVLHVTVTIILATVGDVLVVAVISWALGDPASQSLFTKKFVKGIKILSVFGVSASYTIYLAYSLLQDVFHVVRLVREDRKENKEIE